MTIRALLAERLSSNAETKLYQSFSKRYPYFKSMRSIARQSKKVPTAKDAIFSPFAKTVKELEDLGWVKVSKSRVVSLTPQGKRAYKVSDEAYAAARANREKHAATPRGRKALEIEKAEREAFLAKDRRSKRKYFKPA